METEKTLILHFKKSNGNAFSFNVGYPKDDLKSQDIKALAAYIITNKMFVFKDNVTVSSFEKAEMEEVNTSPVSLEA
ncbi:MAG: DUF2922 domain-containing protein [Proteocatella sp.]